MKPLNLFFTLILSLTIVSLPSCTGIQTGHDLSEADISYIKGLGILDDKEEIILFETHSGWVGGKRISGNYFTSKRIAGYWIDKRNKSKDINSAFYSDIDTITTTDLSRSLTMASYFLIKKKNGQEFKIFISPNQAETSLFFTSAISEWKKYKQQYHTHNSSSALH